MLSCKGSQFDNLGWNNQILIRNRKKLVNTHFLCICLYISINIWTKVVHNPFKDIGYAA